MSALPFADFVKAVVGNVGTVGFPYPGHDCYIWVTEKKRIAELWHDAHNARAELQLHKMNDPQLLVAAFALTETGAKDVAFQIENYFLRV